jgi:hypothetical protein
MYVHQFYSQIHSSELRSDSHFAYRLLVIGKNKLSFLHRLHNSIIGIWNCDEHLNTLVLLYFILALQVMRW